MRLLRPWFLLPLFLLLGGSAGFDRPAPRASSKPADKPAEKPAARVLAFEASLDDQSVVRVSLLQEQVRVTTPYGVLTVPARDIRPWNNPWNNMSSGEYRVTISTR